MLISFTVQSHCVPTVSLSQQRFPYHTSIQRIRQHLVWKTKQKIPYSRCTSVFLHLLISISSFCFIHMNKRMGLSESVVSLNFDLKFKFKLSSKFSRDLFITYLPFYYSFRTTVVKSILCCKWTIVIYFDHGYTAHEYLTGIDSNGRTEQRGWPT